VKYLETTVRDLAQELNNEKLLVAQLSGKGGSGVRPLLALQTHWCFDRRSLFLHVSYTAPVVITCAAPPLLCPMPLPRQIYTEEIVARTMQTAGMCVCVCVCVGVAVSIVLRCCTVV